MVAGLGVEDVMMSSDLLAEIRSNNNPRSKSSRTRGEEHDPGTRVD